MAFFNPKPVTFNPSPQIMQGMGAIGDTLENLYKQNYKEAQNQQRNDMINNQFGLQQQKFNYDQNRASTQDNQWQKTFDANKHNFDVNHQTLVDKNNADIALQNKQLGLKQAFYDNQKKEYEDKQTKLNNERNSDARLFGAKFPALARQLGIQNVVGGQYDDMGNIIQQPTNEYHYENMPDNKSIHTLIPETRGKGDDPIKALMASIAGQRVTDAKEKADNDSRIKIENAKNKRIKDLFSQLNTNSTSLLGIDPGNLNSTDHQEFLQDISKNGQVGHIIKNPNSSGADYRYIPSTVVEKRVDLDGGILVKYSDGTSGEL